MEASTSRNILTAERMLSLPRPGAAVPSPDSRFYLQTSSRFDFDKERTSRSVYVGKTKAKSAAKQCLADLQYLECAWLDDDHLLYLRPPASHADRPDIAPELSDKEVQATSDCQVWVKAINEDKHYCLACLPVQIANVTVYARAAHSAMMVFSAHVYPEDPHMAAVDRLKKAHKAAKRGADVRIYDNLLVRHWDAWTEETVSHIFALQLRNKDGTWLAEEEVISPMAQSGTLQCPVGPFGGVADFDVSPDGKLLAFTSKHPMLNPAWHTNQPIYVVPLSPRNADEKTPRSVTSGSHGATTSPVFSPDGRMLAWVEQSVDGSESDRWRVVVHSLDTARKLSSDLAGPQWTLSCKRIRWARDGKTIYATAEDRGHQKLFSLAVDGQSSPAAYTHKHTVASFASLSDDKLLLTINSISHPNEIYTLDLKSDTLEHVNSIASSLPEFGTSEEFWFYGARGDVHGFLARPPGFKEGKKYPLAFLVHGGPQGAWLDQWSVRWNLATWAAAGYIVVAINPTGSTGYGQAFTDAINNDWGGAPYKDLAAGLDFVLKAYPEIDQERMIAAGASFGGYMMNWFQGHPLGFKALICHDGIFSTFSGFYATEELWFPEHDHNGTPWENPSAYAKHDPSNHCGNWSTPMLVIHGGFDFRLTVAEGLSAFNVLQRRGVPSRFLYFDKASHWINSALDGRMWHEEIFRWMAEWAPPDDESEGLHVTNRMPSRVQ